MAFFSPISPAIEEMAIILPQGSLRGCAALAHSSRSSVASAAWKVRKTPSRFVANDLPPMGQRLVTKGRGLGDPGIGDADRHGSARLGRRGDAAPDRGLFANVHPQRVQAWRVRRHRLQPAQITARDRHLGPGRGQRPRDIQPDPPCRRPSPARGVLRVP